MHRRSNLILSSKKSWIELLPTGVYMASIPPLSLPRIVIRATTKVHGNISRRIVTSHPEFLVKPRYYHTSLKMSSAHPNNTGGTYTQTGTKHSDPYKEKNLDNECPLKDKVQDLVEFVEGLKFGLMTTRQRDSGYLVSRCMAVAARVWSIPCI